MTPQDVRRSFVPAAGRDFLLPLYDPLVRWLGADRARADLLQHIDLQAGERILDVGCGTGTLVVELKRAHRRAHVVGVDPDPRALARAQRKARRAGIEADFDRGFADALPYPDDSFDRVLSSFMFHHLESVERVAMLSEVRRVLRPGGTFHLMDFDHRPGDERGLVARLLHRSPSLQDNREDRMLSLFADAGLVDTRRVDARSLLVGTVAYYAASEPA